VESSEVRQQQQTDAAGFKFTFLPEDQRTQGGSAFGRVLYGLLREESFTGVLWNIFVVLRKIARKCYYTNATYGNRNLRPCYRSIVHTLTSSSAMIFSSSSSSWTAEAAITGGVEAGRGLSEGVRLSFTTVLGTSQSSSIWKGETETVPVYMNSSWIQLFIHM